MTGAFDSFESFHEHFHLNVIAGADAADAAIVKGNGRQLKIYTA